MKRTKILLTACLAVCAIALTNAQSITWAHLQWEASATVTAGSDFEALGLVFADGITNVAEPDGTAIEAQIGYGPVDSPTDSRWTWQNAAYNGVWDANNNIKYQDKIAAPAINGTFYYSFRFRLAGQEEWVYAGDGGIWDGSSHLCKTFTVTNGYEITWAHLQWEASNTINAGANLEAGALVIASSITDAVTPDATAISAQIGYGSTADPTDGSWTWTDAAYNAQWDNAKFYYQQTIATPLISGTYYYTFRFKLNAYAGAWWVYAGDGGIWDGSSHLCKTFTVENGYEITWTSQNWIAKTNITSADNLEAAAEVYCNGISTEATPDESKILAEIGYGTTADPTDGSWTWASAAYNRKSGDNMLYQQAVAAPASEGTYYCSFRFKLNTYGAWWVYAGNGGVWHATDHPCNTFTVNNHYSRSVPVDAIGTVCIPFEVSAYAGVTLYEIAYLEKDGMDQPVQIFLDEVSEATMTAGKPYIFVANADEMVLTYNTAVKVNEPIAGTNGLVGSFVEIAAAVDNVLVDNYIISNNQFWTCGTNCSLPANRAYINAATIQTTPADPAPGRNRIALGNGQKAPTAIDNINALEKAQKIMVNGQMMIVCDGVYYNAQGQMVK